MSPAPRDWAFLRAGQSVRHRADAGRPGGGGAAGARRHRDPEGERRRGRRTELGHYLDAFEAAGGVTPGHGEGGGRRDRDRRRRCSSFGSYATRASAAGGPDLGRRGSRRGDRRGDQRSHETARGPNPIRSRAQLVPVRGRRRRGAAARDAVGDYRDAEGLAAESRRRAPRRLHRPHRDPPRPDRDHQRVLHAVGSRRGARPPRRRRLRRAARRRDHRHRRQDVRHAASDGGRGDAGGRWARAAGHEFTPANEFAPSDDHARDPRRRSRRGDASSTTTIGSRATTTGCFRTNSTRRWRRPAGSGSPCRRNTAAPASASPRRRS